MKISKLLACTVLGLTTLAFAAEPSKTKKPTTAPTTKPAATQAAAKPVNTKCPIMDEAVDAKVTTVYKGKTVGFCCESCIEDFNKDPEKYMAKLK